jgi:tetratricopeptide (TPR) repeat protein
MQDDHMTALSRQSRPTTGSRRPSSMLVRAIGLIGAAVLIAVLSQVVAAMHPAAPARTSRAPAALSDPVTGGNPPTVVDLDVGAGPVTATDADTVRIKANIAFWSAKLTAHTNDFVAAEKLGESQIELARATGDLSAYVAAGQAFDTALTLYPDMAAARAFKGVVLVSLHHFDEARTLANSILAQTPDDPTSLATLGDASLELGDVAAARTAYDRLAVLAPGAAASVRLGHLAFIVGDNATAIRDARAAVKQSDADEDAVGERAGFYRYQLADTLLATGDRTGAEKAYRDAIAHDPRSFLAHAGLGRALAADGRLDEAITELSAAIAIVPQPDMLARRSDLYQLRNAAGDAKRSEADRRTVLAIAQLASSAGNVYDRTLALYLANHDLEPDHAVDLAATELAIRKDVYGYDALAWALLADGRVADADAAIRTAMGFGTKDAKILYHAGMIGLALGDTARARTQLQAALDLDPSFDALQAERARAALSGL